MCPYSAKGVISVVNQIVRFSIVNKQMEIMRDIGAFRAQQQF